MDTATYINILTDTLVKKIKVLDELTSVIKVQDECLSSNDVDLEAFDEMLTRKDVFIEQLNQLDDGFEKIYSRVQEELSINSAKYKANIVIIQGYIKDIMEKSTYIQVKERQSKLKFDSYLMNQKNEIKNFKTSNQTVSSYYKNMANAYQGESYFLDKKK